MNRAQKNQVANLALDVLLANSRYFVNTTHLWHNIKADAPSWCDQAHLRAILNTLRINGTVERVGSGKHKWKILVSSWDRDNPLSVQAGATPITTEPDDDLDVSDDDSVEEPTIKKYVEGINEIGSESAAELHRLKNRVSGLEKEREEQSRVNRQLLDVIETLTVETKSLREQMERQVRVLKIEKWDGKVIKLKDVVLPSNFDHVLDLAKCRRNILLVGPAGCGKSTLAELVAKTLGLDFYKVGGSGGLSEEHLLGYSRPNLTGGKDKFITTPFLTAFESGGLCLVDELDGANENALLALNPALDRSNKLPVPNRETKPIAIKHEEFVCIGTANTHGRGATREYVGRNQLDEATIDRFRIGIVECDYDEVIEAAVCPDETIRNWCHETRKKIRQCGLRRIMSTRFMEDAYTMKMGAGWELPKVQEAFFEGWSAEEKGRIY